VTCALVSCLNASVGAPFLAIWLRGLKRWCLVLGGVAVGRGFEPQSDLELFSTKNINIATHYALWSMV
jgi:hypothetical protein